MGCEQTTRIWFHTKLKELLIEPCQRGCYLFSIGCIKLKYYTQRGMTALSVINDLTRSKEKCSGYSEGRVYSHEGVHAFEVKTEGHVLQEAGCRFMDDVGVFQVRWVQDCECPGQTDSFSDWNDDGGFNWGHMRRWEMSVKNKPPGSSDPCWNLLL